MAVKYFSVKSVAQGINTQLPGSMVTWATGRNVRFTPGYVSKTLGKTLLATVAGSVPVRATFTFVGTDGAVRTIVCCDTAVYAYDANMANPVTITPTPAPTGGASHVWQFALVSGLPILSNGKDVIWKWSSYAGVLTALAGAPTFAKRISSCMHRLIVSNLSEGGFTYPGRVRWTEPGNPENWTIDTTGKSGRFDIVDYNTDIEALANIKAQLARGSKMFFFTERGLWWCDFAQATKQFIEADPEVEILSSKALCSLNGSIYWLGKKDAYRTMEGQAVSIGLPIRDDLFNGLNTAYLSTAFAFAMKSTGEVWFCVATGSNTVPDTAYIFNAELDVWSIADVNFSCHGEWVTVTTDVGGDIGFE
jgi:hypothetical protein